MTIPASLIEKFLANKCTAAEAVQVEAYFSAHPEELEKYLGLKKMIDNQGIANLDQQASNRMLDVIRKNTYSPPAPVYKLPWLRYVAAASVVGIMLLIGAKFFSNPGHANIAKTTARQPLLADSIQSTNIQVVRNTRKEPLVIQLQDSSTVTLQPNSTLEYPKPFTAGKRQLYLAGTAFFKVAKDLTRPFIVTAGGFNTTALGTSFIIAVEKSMGHVTVQLITGKVVVGKADTADNKFTNVYLSPGQQVQIDKLSLAAVVTKIKDDDRQLASGITGSTGAKQDLFDFKQASLPEIFITLEKQFKVSIIYNPNETAKMTFTGKFGNREDITSILDNIAVLHGLTIVKTDKGYEVKK